MIIDQLPLLSGDVESTDEIPIERGTTTYKTTQAALVKSAADAAAAAQTTADAAQTAADNAQATADEALQATLIKNTYTKAAGDLPTTTTTIAIPKAGVYAVSLAAQCEGQGGNVAVVFQQGSTVFELYDTMDYNWKRVQSVDFLRLASDPVNLTVTTTPTDLNEVVVTIAFLGE